MKELELLVKFMLKAFNLITIVNALNVPDSVVESTKEKLQTLDPKTAV